MKQNGGWKRSLLAGPDKFEISCYFCPGVIRKNKGSVNEIRAWKSLQLSIFVGVYIGCLTLAVNNNRNICRFRYLDLAVGPILWDCWDSHPQVPVWIRGVTFWRSSVVFQLRLPLTIDMLVGTGRLKMWTSLESIRPVSFIASRETNIYNLIYRWPLFWGRKPSWRMCTQTLMPKTELQLCMFIPWEMVFGALGLRCSRINANLQGHPTPTHIYIYNCIYVYIYTYTITYTYTYIYIHQHTSTHTHTHPWILEMYSLELRSPRN